MPAAAALYTLIVTVDDKVRSKRQKVIHVWLMLCIQLEYQQTRQPTILVCLCMVKIIPTTVALLIMFSICLKLHENLCSKQGKQQKRFVSFFLRFYQTRCVSTSDRYSSQRYNYIFSVVRFNLKMK